MRETRQVRQVLPTAVIASLLFVALTLSQALMARTTIPTAWRGYSTLLVSGNIELGEVVARLERGVPQDRIVSALTSTVSLTLVPRREDVPVAGLEERLDPLDPRWDPYMRKLPSMFRVESSLGPLHVLYLRALPTPGILGLRVAALMRGIEGTWSLPDSVPLQGPFALLAAVVFLVLLGPGARSRKSRAFLALAALPWLAGCFFGDLTDLLAFYLVYPFCAALLGQLRLCWPEQGRLADLGEPRVRTRVATLGLAVLAASLMVAGLGGSHLDVLRLPLSLCADGVLLSLFVLWGRSTAARADHRVFVPVVIGRRLRVLAPARRGRTPAPGLPRERRAARLGGARGLAILAVVCLSPALFLLSSPKWSVGFPAPEAAAPRAGWDGLSSLWLSAREDELPNLADYVAHEAYQQSLAWGGVYELPARETELAVQHYAFQSDPPAVVADRRTVVRYTDRWLRNTLAGARAGSVDALLADQNRSSRVKPAAAPATLARRPVFWKIGIAFAMVGLLLVLGSQILGLAPSTGGQGATIARRRQLEA